MSALLDELRAQVLLVEQGKCAPDTVYEPLREALMVALQEAQQTVLPRREPLWELAHLMARLRDVRSLGLVMQVDALGLAEPLELLLQGLAKRARPEDFAALRSMLALLWEKRARLVQALKIAEALVQMVERQPLPEHRRLLGQVSDFAALRTAPLEFLELLPRLNRALGEPFDASQTCWLELQFLYRGGLDQAELARQRLVKQGPEVVPQVLELLRQEIIVAERSDDYQRKSTFAALHLSYRADTIQRLSELLADLKDGRALPLLLRVAWGFESVEDPALRLIAALGAQGDAQTAAELIAALRTLQAGPRLPRCAVALGRALVEIAERTPSEALSAALPLLNHHLGAPLELYRLRQRLKSLLPKRTLPIPGSAPAATEDLPIPTENGLS